MLWEDPKVSLPTVLGRKHEVLAVRRPLATTLIGELVPSWEEGV
jgi:hypothetical protein